MTLGVYFEYWVIQQNVWKNYWFWRKFGAKNKLLLCSLNQTLLQNPLYPLCYGNHWKARNASFPLITIAKGVKWISKECLIMWTKVFPSSQLPPRFSGGLYSSFLPLDVPFSLKISCHITQNKNGKKICWQKVHRYFS